MSRSKAMIALCVVAMLGVLGCSSDDVKDIIDGELAGPATEAALEDAVNEVIIPLNELQNGLLELVWSRGVVPVTLGLGCPVTDGVCMSGSLSCFEIGGDSEGSDMRFEFSDCDVSEDGEAFTIDGLVRVHLAVPARPPRATVHPSNVTINGGAGITGTIQENLSTCAEDWNVLATDGTSVTATITQCDEDENPQSGSTFTITVQDSGEGTLVIVVTFDGTNTASAVATLNGEPYATCDLTLEPLDASCDGS